MSDQYPPPPPGDPNIPPPPPGGGYTPPPPPPGYGQPEGGYGAPPPGYGGPAYGGAPVQNKKALWSLILGILGFVCCGVVLGIVAIVLGQQAKGEIAASNGMQTGEGMAKAGVILGIIAIVVNLVSIPIILSMNRG